MYSLSWGVIFLRKEIGTLQDQLNTVQTHSLLHQVVSRLLDERMKENIGRKLLKLLFVYVQYFKLVFKVH